MCRSQHWNLTPCFEQIRQFLPLLYEIYRLQRSSITKQYKKWICKILTFVMLFLDLVCSCDCPMISQDYLCGQIDRGHLLYFQSTKNSGKRERKKIRFQYLWKVMIKILCKITWEPLNWAKIWYGWACRIEIFPKMTICTFKVEVTR